MNIAMLLSPKCNISFLINENSVRKGIENFKVHGYSSVPVINKDGTYYGIVSDKDFLSYIIKSKDYSLQNFEEVRIDEIIEEGLNPPVNINASLNELLVRISDWNFVPIVDSRNKFVGIITRKSVIKYLCDVLKQMPAIEVHNPS